MRVYPLRSRVKSGRKKGPRATPRQAALNAANREAKAASARKAEREKLRALRVREISGAKKGSSVAVSAGRAASDFRLPDLRNLEMSKILGIWKNAIRLYASEDPRKHRSGRLALEAIEAEWASRGIHALERHGYFSWPATDAAGRTGELSFSDIPTEGMLAYFEYHVGRTRGEARTIRRSILDRVFLGELPPVFPQAYLAEWSKKESASRLKKLAESLAAFCRNAKRRDTSKLDDAIKDWEADLAYLKDKYYVSRFSFGWPSSRSEQG